MIGSFPGPAVMRHTDHVEADVDVVGESSGTGVGLRELDRASGACLVVDRIHSGREMTSSRERVFTSTTTTVSPSRATMSISPKPAAPSALEDLDSRDAPALWRQELRQRSSKVAYQRATYHSTGHATGLIRLSKA